MHATAKIQELRRATNPLFNDRKLKLGTFCTNLSGGMRDQHDSRNAGDQLAQYGQARPDRGSDGV